MWSVAIRFYSAAKKLPDDHIGELIPVQEISFSFGVSITMSSTILSISSQTAQKDLRGVQQIHPLSTTQSSTTLTFLRASHLMVGVSDFE